MGVIRLTDLKNQRSGYISTSDIKLEGGSLFAESERVGADYIKSLDINRLLAPSYEMHGVTPPHNAKRYEGWERKRSNNWAPDGGAESHTLAGHSLGHWLSAAASFYRAQGDAELLGKISYAVNKLCELQEETGSAYIGGCPEETFKKCFSSDPDWVKNYWVPWYGIHKIYQGLIDIYMYCPEPVSKISFKVLKRFVDWAVDGISGLSDEFMQEMLNEEHGGMNEIFAFMYKFTGDIKYLETAVKFTHKRILEPLESGEDKLSGLHANTQIPKIVGAAQIYECDREKYEKYRRAGEAFWDFVVNDRSYVIGGNSIGEHFEIKGLESLGIKTCESCNTYNMMRLTELLYGWDHRSEYIDWYESALYNHILGQQEPETGAKMYFISLLPGHHRVYEEKEKSWWCCTGTGMENPGRYTRVMYYEEGDELYVNLYMPNELVWRSKGFELKTETKYPYSDKVRITVKKSGGSAGLMLRVPAWCDKMSAAVDGEIYNDVGTGYISLRRDWQDGDVIDITIPMKTKLYSSRAQGQIAYKYGPVALAAPLGSVKNAHGVKEYIMNETRIDSVTKPVPYIITNGEAPEGFAETEDKDSLKFRITPEHSSTGMAIELRPFYEIHHEFYTVYFNVDSEADRFIKELNDMTVDKVEPDGQQDELGHGFMTNISGEEHRSTFVCGGESHMYRDAWGDCVNKDELPYFSYTLSVSKGRNYVCVVNRAESPEFECDGVKYRREFCIYAENEKIGECVTEENKSGMMYGFYEIPMYLTAGKESVTIRLEAKTSSSCACVSELRITTDVVTK